MQIKNLVAALAGMAVVEASVAFLDSPLSAALAKRQQRGGKGGGNNGGNQGGNAGGNNNAGGNQLCLNQNNVQTGSQSAGTPAAQQAQSATDNANFINFCSGNTLTNGQQKTGGSCNGVVMGKIPANTKMVSTVLTNPPHNGNIQANQNFDVTLNVKNLQAGSFTDAQATYYSAPQDLSGGGTIIGHVHVTIQDMGNTLTPSQPLDASKFVFFKGINDAGDGNGNLKATVTGGLPAGVYRVCTMSSASNHQPVLMPVAQRGAQDDCNKFTVGGGGGGGNGGGNNANNGQQNNGQQNNGGKGAPAPGFGGFPGGGQNAGFGGGFPGFGNPGAASTQSQTGKASGTPNANKAGQDGAAASKAATSATPSVASSAAAPTQPGGASNKNNGSGKNSNGKSTGSGKGGAKANAINGLAAPAVTDSGDSSRPFSVNGNTFVSKANAAQRACDIQRNSCFDAVNGGKGNGASTADCDAQVQACVQELS